MFPHLGFKSFHDDVIKWRHFPCYWPFVRGIHRSPVNYPHKGQWRGALMLSKQWWGWWFETQSSSLWHHCNVKIVYLDWWVFIAYFPNFVALVYVVYFMLFILYVSTGTHYMAKCSVQGVSSCINMFSQKWNYHYFKLGWNFLCI